MKAIILAAGYATRLYPLTKDTPKPLLNVGGKPMMEHILLRLEEVDAIDEIYVVLQLMRLTNRFWERGNLDSFRFDQLGCSIGILFPRKTRIL